MSVSVVIPVLNEEENLGRCLGSLAYQLEGKDEIIIVDNGSRDRTLEIAGAYKCKLFVYPEVSIGEMRRLGVEEASNPIILEADGDHVFTSGFLNKHRKYYEDPSIVGVRGRILDYKGRMLADFTYNLASQLLQLGHGSYSYRKSIYSQTSGHRDTKWAYDVVLWNEIRKVGKTVYDPDLILYHSGKSSDKYVSLPSYLIGSSLLAGGAAYEYGVGGEAGYAMIGHGLGWIASQAGVDFLKKIPGIEEFWMDPHHFPHHWQIAVMILAGTLAFSDELPSELEMALYGFSTAMFLHDTLTEPRA